MNLFFAAIALVGAVLLLAPHTSDSRPKLDIPGTILVSISLFSIVFGFSKAESDGWSATPTISWLVAGVVFMAAFIYWQTKSEHPLLPLRVVLDRIRAGSYLAIFLSGAGMFAVFLFLTYYMQLILGYSPIMTGLAFMPMVFGIVTAATLSTAVLLPRVGPRVLIVSGMVIAAIGMTLLARSRWTAPMQSTFCRGSSSPDSAWAAFSPRRCREQLQACITKMPASHLPRSTRCSRWAARSELHCSARLPPRLPPTTWWPRDESADSGAGRRRELHHDVLLGRRHIRGRCGLDRTGSSEWTASGFAGR